jgi:hypothetical protein
VPRMRSRYGVHRLRESNGVRLRPLRSRRGYRG